MRRHHAAMLGCALLIAAALEPAATAQPSRSKQKHMQQPAAATAAQKASAHATVTAAPVTLGEIFARAKGTQETAPNHSGMVMAETPNTDVMVVRVSADGTREYGCVNNEAAAREFLAPQSAAPAQKKAKEQ
jgi:hypothetical protein